MCVGSCPKLKLSVCLSVRPLQSPPCSTGWAKSPILFMPAALQPATGYSLQLLAIIVALLVAFFLQFNVSSAKQLAAATPMRTEKQPPDLEVGFCDSSGRGFFREQPMDQLERWEMPFDNGTHLVRRSSLTHQEDC